MIRVIGSRTTGWELVKDGEQEPICVVENVEYDDAIDIFVANVPEWMDQLDELKCDDFCGGPVVEKKTRRNGTGERKRGSGARFRELILQGKSNEECLRIVRAEFPESKATLSDAAWNRAQIKKNPGGIGPDGRKIYAQQSTRNIT